MPTLSIPQRFHTGLTKLISLDEARTNQLLAVIPKTPLTLRPEHLAETISRQVTSIDAKDLEEIVKTLVALYGVRASRDATISEFSEEICSAIERSESTKLRLPSKKRTQFKNRLEKLLALEKTLGLSSKAFDVLTEHQRILVDARIMTDVRAVFGNPKERPTAAVIVHTLKIHYIDCSEHKDFFVALDTSDIQNLRELLDRADQKVESLKAALQHADLPILDVE